MKRIILPIVLSIFVFASCEKDTTPEPSCTDGFQNQGETGPDCGGPCAPCVTPPNNNPYLRVMIDDSLNLFSNTSCVRHVDTFRFQASNNYAGIKFAAYILPSADGTQDSSAMLSQSCEITFGAAVFDRTISDASGLNLINNCALFVDEAEQKLNGNFYFSVTKQSGADTVHVYNGQINSIEY